MANEDQVGFSAMLMSLGPSQTLELMSLTFAPMAILFYGIAVYFG